MSIAVLVFFYLDLNGIVNKSTSGNLKVGVAGFRDPDYKYFGTWYGTQIYFVCFLQFMCIIVENFSLIILYFTY